MKKFAKILCIVSLVILSLFSFGCNSLPTTDESKISFALDKVSSFLADQKGFTQNDSESENVTKIKRFLNCEESDNSFLLSNTSFFVPEYYFLSNSFDRLNKNIMGETLSYTFSSNIGYNFDTFSASNDKSDKHSYEATASIYTNIDDDQISGELGIKFFYDKDTLNERRQSVYSHFDISCDYTSFDNTFSLTMVTIIINAEVDSDFGYNTYNYSHLEVENNMIKTFQNFYISSPAEVFISDTYTVSYYLDSAEFEFVVGAQIYENNKHYYSYHTDPVDEDDFGYTQIKQSLFKCIAVDFKTNSNDYNYYDFFENAQNSSNNKSVYKAYCDTKNDIKIDLPYITLPSRILDYGNIPCETLSLSVCDDEGNLCTTFTLTEDKTITSFDSTNTFGLYYVYYGNAIEKAELENINVYCAYKIGDVLSEFTKITPDTTFSSAYVEAGGYDTNTICIKYELKTNTLLYTQIEVNLANSVISNAEKIWPSAFIKNNLDGAELPTLTNPSSEFVYFTVPNGIEIYIINANYVTEIETYTQLLLSNGFQIADNGYQKINTKNSKTIVVTLVSCDDDENLQQNCFRIRAIEQ